MRRAVIAALSLTLAAASAQAAGPPPAKDKKVGQYVDLSPVALPVIVDRQLVNYVFVHARINLSASADSPKLREKEPYFRDALVRAAHRTPFTLASDFTKLDEAKLKAALMREAAAIAGPRNVASISILSQTPKQRTNVPRPKSGGG